MKLIDIVESFNDKNLIGEYLNHSLGTTIVMVNSKARADFLRALSNSRIPYSYLEDGTINIGKDFEVL